MAYKVAHDSSIYMPWAIFYFIDYDHMMHTIRVYSARSLYFCIGTHTI